MADDPNTRGAAARQQLNIGLRSKPFSPHAFLPLNGLEPHGRNWPAATNNYSRGGPSFFPMYLCMCSGSQRPLFCGDATNACAVPLGYPGMLSRAREVLGCREGASGVARYILYTVTAQLASFADNSAAASPRPPGAGGQLTSTEERRGSVRSENLGNLNGSEKVSGKRPHLPAQTWPV
jgi:hypothetical protein